MHRFALLAIFVVLSAPVSAQDNAAVQKLADQFADAFNKNAATGVGEMYGEDAILVPPEADIRMGRKDIQAFWTHQAKQAEGLTIAVLDTKPIGSDAARAVVRAEMTTKGEKPRHLIGRNVVVLQKLGGDWKIAAHIWNFGAETRSAAREQDRGATSGRDTSRADRDRDRLRELGDTRRGWEERGRYSGRERGYQRDRDSWRENDQDFRPRRGFRDDYED